MYLLMKIMDPWLLSSSNNAFGAEVAMNFEDNFELRNTLPESVEYLASLERKLAALKGRKSRQDLVHSLSERHRSCMEQLLGSSTELQHEEHGTLEQHSVCALLRRIAPERQAVYFDELVQLLKADSLAQTVEDRRDAQ
ncbi:uncharacterized protein LOC134538905 [Bacillus rossius redtenbacheri]|uniref:uncharacterized protein LOC134538905 n=1 Tax=Bacillus rossius redtenbacheri TaxID=93214 RepID=UPI002FDCC1B1